MKYPVGWKNERRDVGIYKPGSSFSIRFAAFFHTLSSSCENPIESNNFFLLLTSA